ncbi:hypothetical protein SBRCBS47491_006958 [Sporothrix bragantina]|uniref:Uncharacterized protein n=1 Tax=Sporothrix bragantina TaxID=671064 RepID=A0ABP0C9M7_9PEZI
MDEFIYMTPEKWARMQRAQAPSPTTPPPSVFGLPECANLNDFEFNQKTIDEILVESQSQTSSHPSCSHSCSSVDSWDSLYMDIVNKSSEDRLVVTDLYEKYKAKEAVIDAENKGSWEEYQKLIAEEAAEYEREKEEEAMEAEMDDNMWERRQKEEDEDFQQFADNYVKEEGIKRVPYTTKKQPFWRWPFGKDSKSTATTCHSQWVPVGNGFRYAPGAKQPLSFCMWTWKQTARHAATETLRLALFGLPLCAAIDFAVKKSKQL